MAICQDDAEVIVCAGPPACQFTDCDAVDAANSGCPFCLHIIVHSDGSETTFQRKAN